MNMFFCCTIAILHFLSSKCMLLDLVALTNEEHWCFLPNQSSDVVDILIVLLSLLLGLPLLHSCATIILDDTYIFGWDLDRFLFPYDECGPSGGPSLGRKMTSYILHNTLHHVNHRATPLLLLAPLHIHIAG